MGLFERVRRLVKPKPVGSLPIEVSAALVDDLYSNLMSFAIAATTAVLVGGIAASRTGSSLLMFLTAATAAIAAARALLMVDYHKHKSSIAADGTALRRWEQWYAVGALAYGACLGSTCFVGLVFIDDPLCQLLLGTYAVGFTAGTTARISSRPWIAITQVSLILLPITLASAFRGVLVYMALSGITFLYYLATIELARYLGANRLRLLLATAEKAALVRSLAEQNFRFDTALANMSHGLCMFDSKRQLLVWNSRFCEIYKIPPEALSPGITIRKLVELSAARGNHPGRTVDDIVSENEARLNSGVLIHSRRLLPDGRIIALSHQPVTGGGAVVLFEDVTEREKAQERARFLATHDDLTELPNRWMFGEAVNDAVKAGHRCGQTFAVMFMDLDRFKNINDTLGHAAGDVLLIETAKRLTECVRKSDVIARIGGDEFVIMLREVSEQSQVAMVARKILSTVVRPLTIHGHECRITASIGISMFPTDALDEESLIKNADAAMYIAKEEGRNGFRFHFQNITTQSIERLLLESSLRGALERDELLLHYQPKQDLGHGGISGVEALLRWQHPDHGLLPPSHFIPLAEETGLIVPIGKWVIETACAQNVAWQRQGVPALRIAVNLSPRQFADPGLLSDIGAALDKSGMAPELLELEITESMVMQNVERAMRMLKAIKGLGVILAIDDFGTGYSSMSLLKKFPIDVLKIDRSFVREITSNSEDKAIADAIIALGRVLNLTIVAEGVETAEQEALLRAHNCDEVQGYLISQPVPADEFAAFMANHALAELKAHVAKAAQGSRPLQIGTRLRR
jgi:diguanylate cyclase (GGDEF)-like protein